MHQFSTVWAAVAAAVLLACGSSGGGGAGSEPTCQSACAGGLSCIAGECSGPVLEFPYAVTDGGLVYMADSVVFRASALGRRPDRLHLVVDERDVGSVDLGIGVLDASGVSDSSHSVALRATYGDRTATARATVVIDRASPRLEWTPAPGEASLVGVTELVGRASEPLHPHTSPADVAAYSPADGEPLPAHVVEVDAAAGVVTVRFAAPLDLANVVALRSQVRDRAGNREWSREYAISQPPLAVRIEAATGEAPMRTYEVTVGPGRAEEVVLSSDDWVWLVSRDTPHRFAVDEDAVAFGPAGPRATATRGTRTFTSDDAAAAPRALSAATAAAAQEVERAGAVAILRAEAARWPASASSPPRTASAGSPAVASVTSAATADECVAPWVWAEGGCHLVSLHVRSPTEGLSTNCGDTYASHGEKKLPIELEIASPVALDEVALLVNGAPRLVNPTQPQVLTCLGDGEFELQVRARVGDRWVESERRHFRVDRVPPTATWTPPSGSRVLPATRDLVATFSEPIDPASFAGITVHAEGDLLQPPGRLSEDGRQLTLTLPKPLSTYDGLTVELHRNQSGVRDLAGNLAAPREVSWRQPPVLVAMRTPRRAHPPYASGVLAYDVTTYGEGVDDVVVELWGWNSSAVLRPVAGPPWRFEVDTAALAEGSYSATAVARRSGLPYRSPTDRWSLDRTPPPATCGPSGTWPGIGTALWLHDSIDVYFAGERITLPGVAASAVTVAGASSGPLPVTVTHTGQDSTAVERLAVTPAAPWPVGDTVQVTIGGGLRDAAGNLVPATVCKVPVPEWLPQRTVTPQTVQWLSVEGASLGRVEGNDYWLAAAWQAQVGGVPAVMWSVHANLGDIVSAPYGAEHPSLAVDPAGHHAIAFEKKDAVGTRQVVVAQYRSAVGMVALGSPLNRDPSRDAREPSLTLGACPVPCPVLAWVEETAEGAAALHASTWSGTAWWSLGDDLRTGGGAAESPVIAVDAADSPVLVWREDGEVFARRWVGSGLGFLDADGPLNHVASATGRPALTLDGGGGAVVAWTEVAEGAARVVVSRWTGAAWEILDGFVNGVGSEETREPSVAVDDSGAPWVAFVEDAAAGARIRVARWDGARWQPVGSGFVTPAPVESPRQLSLRIDWDGVPWIAWVEGAGAPRFARHNE